MIEPIDGWTWAQRDAMLTLDWPFDFVIGDEIGYTEEFRLVKLRGNPPHEEGAGYSYRGIYAMVIATNPDTGEFLLDNGLLTTKDELNKMGANWHDYYTWPNITTDDDCETQEERDLQAAFLYD